MRHQPDNVYLFFHSRPYGKSRADRHHPHWQSHCRRPAAQSAYKTLPAPTILSTAVASTTTATSSRTPPADGTMPDVHLKHPTLLTSNDVDCLHACRNSDCTVISLNSTFGQLATHRTETDDVVPPASIYTRRIHLKYPY
nr:unnamed protein product [Spirometra erinaceieuropaei]